MTAWRAPWAILLVWSSGCVTMIPPPETPAPVAPPLAEVGPVAEGQGRVVIDVVDGPTEVRRSVVHSVVVAMDKDRPIVASAVTTEPLCTSPCIADLALGRHTLAFPTRGSSRRLELGEIEVGPDPSVYLRSLGSYESAGAGLPLGIVSVSFGGAAFVTGVTLLPIGLTQHDGGGMALAGGITLAAGAVLTALGILGIAASPATVQPGADVQFLLPEGVGVGAAAADDPSPEPDPAEQIAE